MARDEVLNALDEAANEQINWAIGDLLRERVLRDDWRQCPLLRQLETTAILNLRGWNTLFRRTREILADPTELPRKAQTLLRPHSPLFDQNLDDFIAEMMAAMYLSRLGHTAIHFPPELSAITTDLTSVRDGITYVTEAKNLREPNSLAYVAFARWHHNCAADPARFNFTAEFLQIDDPFEDLTTDQASAVRVLVDALPGRPRPAIFQTTLPGNRILRVSIADGPRGVLQYGPGPFLVNALVEECRRAVVMKLLDPARKALTQLYSSAVPTDYRRLLFVRWKPPDSVAAIGEADSVRNVVRDYCEVFIRRFFPNFALAILHTHEEIENAPPVAW